MSRMELSHEEVKGLIAPYVLGALPADEVTFVRAHILSCDECMTDADALSESASKLALTAEPVALSDGFLERVMALASGSEPESVTEVTPLAPRRRRPSPWAVLAGAAALLIVAVLSASVFTLRSDLNSTESQLAETRSRISEYERVVSAVLHSDGGMELAGSGAVGRMVPTGDGSVFVVAGMQQAPKNHTYQLWVIEDGLPISAGLFDAQGGVALLNSDLSLDGVEAVAVTIEPDGGSKGPTTEPIMSTRTG